VLRTSSANTFARSARTIRTRTSQQCLRLPQQTGRRGYASATETIKKAGGDAPWAISALAVTIGGTYLALQPRDGGHHDEHHDDHGEDKHEETEDSGVEEKEEGGEEEKPSEPTEDTKSDSENQEKAEDSEATKKDDSEEPKDDSAEPKEDSSEDKSDVSNKGPSKTVEQNTKTEDDAMGKKKRIDSSAGKTLGEGSSSGEGDGMGKKQDGYTNTDTKHSEDIVSSDEKSNKAEGTAETAKLKGTVQPDRPQK